MTDVQQSTDLRGPSRSRSLSRSPPQSRPAPPTIRDVDPKRARERQRQALERERETTNDSTVKERFDPAEEYKRLMELRSGGRYVPPMKLRALQAQMSLDKTSKEYQRIQWDSLKKSINSLINKISVANIRSIIEDVFKCNLVRGRGLFARSIMKAQAASLPFTPVYAALVAVVNTKLPQIGELLISRLVIQFRRAYRRNDRPVCLSATMFIAHLCNQQVCHEILALEILSLLLEQPTNDSVEIAVGFVREAGAYLSESSAAAFRLIFERFRVILQEGNLDKRTQYMIEVLFQVRKDGFKENPAIPAGLDLVEEQDQITHMIRLDSELKANDILNVFKFDPEYQQNEERYETIKREILEGDSEDESDSDISESEEDEEQAENPANVSGPSSSGPSTSAPIIDMTNTQLVNLRKNVYLTIKSTMSIDEACHKLLRIDIAPENRIEIVNMIVECCSQEKVYAKIYGGVGDRLCKRFKEWHDLFLQAFKHYYDIIHRYDPNQIRNIATLFGYMLSSDALDWEAFQGVHVSEADSSSHRIFLNILFQEMKHEIGSDEIITRFKEPYLQPYLVDIFPCKDPSETRFAINYFTAIHFGALTTGMRDYLKNLPVEKEEEDSRGRSRNRSNSLSGSSKGSSYDSGSYSGSSRSRSYSSRSRTDSGSSRSRSRSPYSRSPSPVRGRSSPGRSSILRRSTRPPYSRSPSPGRGRKMSARRRSSRYSSYSRSPSRTVSRSFSGSPRRPRSRSFSSSYRSYSSRSRSRSLDSTRDSRKRQKITSISPKRRAISPRIERSPEELARNSERRVLSDRPSRRSPRRSPPRQNSVRSPLKDLRASKTRRFTSRSRSPIHRARAGPSTTEERPSRPDRTGANTSSKETSNTLPAAGSSYSGKPRDYSPPPQRPKTWAEADRGRVKASDYL